MPNQKAACRLVDAHVGSRVRLRRTLLGMSQEKLGEAIGLTFQQVQKYERGANRIGASRLFDISLVLDVPVSFFFDGLSERSPPPTEPPLQRRRLEMIRNLERLPENQQTAIETMVRALANPALTVVPLTAEAA